jgi:hypothetical protein
MAEKFDYNEANADADELITEFGMDAVLRREGIDDRLCRVAIIDGPRERPGELANPTDRKVYMSAANAEVIATPPDDEKDVLVTFVQPDGTVEDETLPMTCKPKRLAPAGINVFWEFTVRR